MSPALPIIMRSQRRVLTRAVARWSAVSYDPTLDALVDLTGNGLHARLGSSVGPDTNDPLRLQYAGEKYVYGPGATNNYISRSALTAFGTGDFTVSAKVSFVDFTNNKRVVGGAANCFGLGANTSGNPTATKLGGAPLTSTAVLTANVDVVLTYARISGVGYFYVNGVFSDSAADTSDYTVGVTTLMSTSIGNWLSGRFYWARVYNTGLNAASVAADAGGIRQANCVSEVLASAASEPYATVADGISGTWTLNRSSTGRKLAVVDRDMLLLGTDDYLVVANSPLLNFGTGDFTVAATVRDYGSTDGVVMGKNTSSNTGWRFAYSSSRRMISLGAAATGNSPGSSVRDGIADLWCLSRASGTISLSRNGVTQVSAAGADDVSTAADLVLGRYGPSATLYANMEFFGAAIFREALSADDLRRLAAEWGADA